MCIICLEIDKNRLTFLEAARNASEMWGSLDRYHRDDVTKKLIELEKREREENETTS
tara:strand:+ start:297 stop:467 length:171 start_codon:yes stop_codon:yes gene_type:complete